MHLVIHNKKIEIFEYTKLIDRLKSLKFILEPIDYGIKIPHTKWINTYLFCQKVDICITNKNNEIIKLFENTKSEKIKRIRKANNIYYLPLNTTKYLKLKDKIIEKK